MTNAQANLQLSPERETLFIFRPFRPNGTSKLAKYLRKLRPLNRYFDWVSLYRDYDANPRPQEYMSDLVKSFINKYKLANTSEIKDPELSPSPDVKAYFSKNVQIILVYPDAIGLGQSPYEREVLSNSSVWILNGRKRLFRLNPLTHLRLVWRRFLAVTRLTDTLLGIFLFCVGIPLAIYDLGRGKR